MQVTSLDSNEARDDGVLGCRGISWTICKQSAHCSRQITTLTPHHPIFTGWMLFLTPNQQRQSIEGTYLQINTENVIQALAHGSCLVNECYTIQDKYQTNVKKSIE